MIEFKGDCGHTIRARDEDAGKAVRCSYCGREAMVPQREQDDLDALFDEVERTGVYDPQATKVGQKSHRARERTGKRPASARGKPAAQNFDPFAVALKMTYVAVIIIVIVFLWYQVPKLKRFLPSSAANTPPPAATVAPVAPQAEHRPGTLGLIFPSLDRAQSGFFVTSVPTKAAIYAVEGWNVDLDKLQENPCPDPSDNLTNRSIRMNKGRYTVGVALPIDDTDLMRFNGYREVRRKIEENTGALTRTDEENIAKYFIPDGSKQTLVPRIRGEYHILRTYEVDVYERAWTPITAIFLPAALSLEEVVHYLPTRKVYVLDEDAVNTELNYHGVADETDQKYIKDALEIIGKAFYETAPGAYLIFQVRIEDGTIKTERAYR